MQTFIFEGIATSGKSTVIKQLEEALNSRAKVRIAAEDETHVPLMEARKELHLEFFKLLLQRLAAEDPDILILDRLYMTQAYRARCSLSAYRELETFLMQYNPLTIFLSLEENTILERIKEATKHRNPEWLEYVNAKGNERQITDYYIAQQRSQLKLLKESLVPYRIFDTTSHNYTDIANKILKTI